MARAFTGRRMAVVASAGVLALGLAACGGSSDSGSSDSAAPETSAAPAPDGEPVKVTLITKDSTNPFFVAMQEGAKEAAAAQGVDLTVGSGKAEGDDQGQIDLIEQAIARGDAGTLITPVPTNVNADIEKALAAGLYVIALDTPTDPPETVDITFATDNCLAGEAIGQWTAGWLNGEKATIARLVIFNDRMVSVDYCRDNGFLRGMGIDIADLTVMGDEAESGTYTTGAGGEYEWVCLEATGANQEGGRAGMEKCLAANPDINVVYTINEPTAFGAAEALKAAGKTIGTDVIIVSVDGGLAGVEAVKAGEIQATSQQYPLLMASLGVEAIATIANGGAPPQNTSANGQFFDTGVKLCTEDPQDTVTAAGQWTAQQCIDNAWG